MIDLGKLSPAPWMGSMSYIQITDSHDESVVMAEDGAGILKAADCEFIVLARNAFDGDPVALTWWEANRKRRNVQAT